MVGEFVLAGVERDGAAFVGRTGMERDDAALLGRTGIERVAAELLGLAGMEDSECTKVLRLLHSPALLSETHMFEGDSRTPPGRC